jgi:xylulose-5-phosphate/fructose-6-phosphate phosphoketolase
MKYWGYKEKGNIDTPLELAILNQTDRFSLAIDVIDRVPKLQSLGAHAKERFRNQQLECRTYAYENGIDKPEIVHWKWTDSAGGTKSTIAPRVASIASAEIVTR